MLNKLKKTTEIAKLKKEIKAIDFKKTSMSASTEQEKLTYTVQKTEIFKNIGENIFNNRSNSDTSFDFSTEFEEILALDSKMVEADQKLTNMIERYQEEIDLLHKSIEAIEIESMTPKSEHVTIPATSNDVAEEVEVCGEASFCSNCGNGISSSTIFCSNCGTKTDN